MSSKDHDNETETEEIIDPVEVQISSFAATLGVETGKKFFVYIYRMSKSEESGRKERTFLKRLEGFEPDPQDIAERYRGGRYLITFCWKHGKANKSKSYVLPIDEIEYPPLPKGSGTDLIPAGAFGQMDNQTRFQFAMLQTVAEIMKSSIQNSSPPVQAVNPLEQMTGIMDAVENNFTSMMAIQNSVWERMFKKTMEKRLGLESEAEAIDPAGQAAESEESGFIGKYAPMIKEVVDGLKMVFSMFGAGGGEVPREIVKKVEKTDRFQALKKDPRALQAVGQALRREFGDERAKEIMRSFGVIMEIKEPLTVSPVASGSVPINGKAVIPVTARVTTGKAKKRPLAAAGAGKT